MDKPRTQHRHRHRHRHTFSDPNPPRAFHFHFTLFLTTTTLHHSFTSSHLHIPPMAVPTSSSWAQLRQQARSLESQVSLSALTALYRR